MNAVDRSLARLLRMKREKIKITSSWDERGYFTTYPMDFKRI